MENSSKNSGGQGVGVFDLLGVAFVVLKLTKVISWSWWLVTLPFWGVTVLNIIILLIVLIVNRFEK